METLFKFMFIRQPEPNNKRPVISLAQESTLQDRLINMDTTDLVETARQAVEEFAKSAEFLNSPDALEISEELSTLSAEIDTLEDNGNLTEENISTAIENAFGVTPQQMVSSDGYAKSVSALKDSLLAIKLLPEVQDIDALEMTEQLKGLELIAKIAANDFENPGSDVPRLRRAPLQWPSFLEFDLSTKSEVSQEKFEENLAEEDAKNQRQLKGKVDRLFRYEKALKELSELSPDKYITTEQVPLEAVEVPKDLEPEAIMRKSIEREDQLFDMDLKRYETYVSESQSLTQAPQQPPVNFANFSSLTKDVQAQIYNPRPSLTSFGPFRPTSLEETSFMLKPEVIESLSSDTLGVLGASKLNLKSDSHSFAMEKLENEIRALTEEVEIDLEEKPIIKMKRVGRKLIVTKIPVQTEGRFARGISKIPAQELEDLISAARPKYKNKYVRCSGIADLLIVKQQLIRYEGADVAHIENVLSGEKKEREYTSRRLTSETIFSESENTNTQENEYESSSRFEMSSETNKTIKSDSSRTSGLSLSGKYGMAVEFKANLSSTRSRGKQTSTKAAESFSRDITERSATKISERALERVSRTSTNETTDRSLHSLDNSASAGTQVSGVYQWVNKVYQAQMFNYGARGVYEFMVPEPAAYFIHTLENAQDTEVIEAPTPLGSLSVIHRGTYKKLARRFRALDVQPPPPKETMTSYQHHSDSEDFGSISHSTGINIPPGYRVVGATVVVLGVARSNSVVDVTIGNKSHRFWNIENLGENANRRRRTLTWNLQFEDHFEGEKLPFAFVTGRTRNLTVTVKVKCKLTSFAYEEWRLETFAKLERAYQKQMEDYEDKMAALEARAGVEISGKNPEANMQIMREEMKKHCLYILTERSFGGRKPAMARVGNKIPFINLARNKELGAYVRFFEQAFEWENMTWITYPYFWGNRDKWEERIHYEDNDPVFQDFLKSGYCRISVPARLEFMAAIDHFLVTGEVWNGEDVPPVVSDLFIPIAEEIAERLDRPGVEVPQGEPWQVRVPTSLVHLRPDDKLPVWVQNDDGEWVEEED